MGYRNEVILLDTHVLIWLSAEPHKLSKIARSAIRRAQRGGGIAISAITLWELAFLASRDRLELTGTLEAFLEEVSSRASVRPITTRIAALAAKFPASYSNDPCDRIIGATAVAEGMVVVTKDSRMHDCRELQTVW